jgi:DNA-directed RNA polymerase specialized sigma subunit
MTDEQAIKLKTRIKFVASQFFNLSKPEDLEDISHSVLLLILKSKIYCDSNINQQKIKYLIIDYIRSLNFSRKDAKLPEFVEFTEEHEGVDDSLESRLMTEIDAKTISKKAFRILTPIQRAIFKNMYIRGLSNIETAIDLKVSAARVCVAGVALIENLKQSFKYD